MNPRTMQRLLFSLSVLTIAGGSQALAAGTITQVGDSPAQLEPCTGGLQPTLGVMVPTTSASRWRCGALQRDMGLIDSRLEPALTAAARIDICEYWKSLCNISRLLAVERVLEAEGTLAQARLAAGMHP